MAAVNEEMCALCGQPVIIEGFTQQDTDGIKRFCCAGCLSLFQLLFEHSETKTITTKTTPK